MGKTIGGADEGGFYLLVTYETKACDDMEEMGYVLGDSSADSYVTRYDDEHVEVKIRHPYEEL